MVAAFVHRFPTDSEFGAAAIEQLHRASVRCNDAETRAGGPASLDLALDACTHARAALVLARCATVEGCRVNPASGSKRIERAKRLAEHAKLCAERALNELATLSFANALRESRLTIRASAIATRTTQPTSQQRVVDLAAARRRRIKNDQDTTVPQAPIIR
ncbi:MAG: hypothetical protein V4684_06165 [Pseudomonadota bacterium]